MRRFLLGLSVFGVLGGLGFATSHDGVEYSVSCRNYRGDVVLTRSFPSLLAAEAFASGFEQNPSVPGLHCVIE